jgi:hypothetical protein
MIRALPRPSSHACPVPFVIINSFEPVPLKNMHLVSNPFFRLADLQKLLRIAWLLRQLNGAQSHMVVRLRLAPRDWLMLRRKATILNS